MALLLAAAMDLAPQAARAGELDRSQITDYRVWKSIRCYQPQPPAVQITDTFTFNLAVDAFNRYLGDMSAYLDCAGREANEDYAAIKHVLEDSLARIREEAIADLDATRNQIERYRPLYADPAFTAERTDRR